MKNLIETINKSYGYERVAIVKPIGRLAILTRQGIVVKYITRKELKNL